MALCRIYLCTYQRPKLLRRALESLLSQTFRDWVCELHNDDPADTFPKELSASINDARIILVNHAQNLGPTQTFNLVFQPVDELFVSLLEDDNWWNPNFLEVMIDKMKRFPHVNIAWSNMRMWKENEADSWIDLQKGTFPFSIEEPDKLFEWGHPFQISGALHSQGAMLVRTQDIEKCQVPSFVPSACIEHVRERVCTYPILFVNQELANFAATRSTSRSKDPAEWMVIQLFLSATFFKNNKLNHESLGRVWQDLRARTPSSTGSLFWSALLYPECRYVLNRAVWSDWLLFFLRVFKRPFLHHRYLRRRKKLSDFYDFLDNRTQRTTAHPSSSQSCRTHDEKAPLR